MSDVQSLDGLIEALRRLPGVGIKSAQRMAFHLLQRDQDGARQLARALTTAVESVSHCERCHTFTEGRICSICQDDGRDSARLCVVEAPADMGAMERTGAYNGYYYVLMGRLSPLDGIGPRDLNLSSLLERAGDGKVQEVILATSFTAEGEATAHARR
jgi:recombination protein RecR